MTSDPILGGGKVKSCQQIDLDNFQMWTIFPQPSNNLFFFTKGVFSSAMISDKKEELSVLWHLVPVSIGQIDGGVLQKRNLFSFEMKSDFFCLRSVLICKTTNIHVCLKSGG